MQPARSLTASSWQYSVRSGFPPYFRTQAFACTPHSGARSVAVEASKPWLRNALTAEPKYGAGVPNGSMSTMSNRFLGEALQLSTQLASLCLRVTRFFKPVEGNVVLCQLERSLVNVAD